jgi:hypothetical protein
MVMVVLLAGACFYAGRVAGISLRNSAYGSFSTRLLALKIMVARTAGSYFGQ